jgi:hypothetical protein
MPRRYSYPEVGAGTVWLQCAMCEHPFRVWRYRLSEGAKFCSIPCRTAAQHAFSDALKAGLLDGILSEARARAKAQAVERLKRTSRSPGYWHDGGGLETARERQKRELGAPLDSE